MVNLQINKMKIVINTCFGGFCLSPQATQKYRERTGKTIGAYTDVERNDPDLVAVVEELGEKASGVGSRLKIVDIPEDIQWYIEEYDGREHVAEEHRRWG